MEHVYGVIEGVAVAAIIGGFAWLVKLRSDLDIAFVKIRALEELVKDHEIELFGAPLEPSNSGDRSR